MKKGKMKQKVLAIVLSTAFVFSGGVSVLGTQVNFIASADTNEIIANSNESVKIKLTAGIKNLDIKNNHIGNTYLLVDVDTSVVKGHSDKFKTTDKPLELQVVNGANTYTTYVEADKAEYSAQDGDFSRFYVPCGNVSGALQLKIVDPNAKKIITDEFNIRVYDSVLSENVLKDATDYASIGNNNIVSTQPDYSEKLYKGFVFNSKKDTLLIRPTTKSGDIRLYLGAGGDGFSNSGKSVRVRYYSDKKVYDKVQNDGTVDPDKYLKTEFQEHEVTLSSSLDSIDLPWYPDNSIIELYLHGSNNFLLNLKVENIVGNISGPSGPVVTPEKPSVPLNINTKRFSSSNRYDTAIELSKHAFSSSKVAVIASGENFADALSGGPLASINNAPLLLVKDTSTAEDVNRELNRLGVEKLYILGGENSISMKTELKMAVDKNNKMREVVRISGKDRFDTSSKIYNEYIKYKGTEYTAVIVNGWKFADALSAGPVAAHLKKAIVLTDGKTLNGQVSKTDKYNLVIGGTDSVNSSFTGGRISGKDRYETSSLLARGYFENAKNVLVTSGVKYPDGLASISLYGKYKAPLLLVEKNSLPTYIKAYLKATSPEKAYVVGGTDSVSTSVVTEISKLTK